DIGAVAEWRFYKGKTGWRLLACKGGRNLAYLKPSAGSVLVSLALSDRVLDAAERAGVAKSLIETVRSSKLLPEGRAARVEVTSVRDVTTVLKLVACKAKER